MKKKLLTLLLAGCMVFAVTACGGDTTEQTENEVQTEDAAEDTSDATDAETTETVDDSAVGTSKLVELGEYKGLTYTVVDTTVTDEEVEVEVQYLLSSSPAKNAQEVATETSIVNIDYVGTKDGVAFDGGTAEGQELDLGNSNYIEGFAESIVGMKVGETKDCPMTFPEDYGVEELNGADVVFTITVNECWEEVPAELNDEFAVNNGYENVDALYAGVKASIEATKKDNADTQMKSELVYAAIDNSTFEVTEEEIAYYVADLEAQYEYYASYYGVDMETYVTAMTGMTMEDFAASCRESAIYTIKSGLLQTAIVENEGLQLADGEYEEKAAEYMEYFGYASLEEFEAAYSKETITNQILADKAMAVLVDNAVAAE